VIKKLLKKKKGSNVGENKDEILVIKVKRLDKELPLPRRAYPTDSGWDLYSREDVTIPPKSYKAVNCGVIFSMPPEVECQVRGRSGFAFKGVFTHFGTVDSNFRGEVGPILFNMNDFPFQIHKGERVCQVVFMPKLGKYYKDIQLIEVDEVDETDRGSNGFGSTGVK